MIQEIYNMEIWLAEIRSHLSKEYPELLATFDIYSGEAVFGRRYISSNLQELSLSENILEVGAGSLLLSCQLVREGYNVTSLEPFGDGFNHFKRMQKFILKWANQAGCAPTVLNLTAEKLSIPPFFDFAFSVNVMEHVLDIKKVIQNVLHSLKLGASYRFTCPNYLFPYEPHFNIPTFISKNITMRLFSDKILNHKTLPDPEGTWNSLNWITVSKIHNSIISPNEYDVSFNKKIIVTTFERITSDKKFADRRSKLVRIIINSLVKIRLHFLLGLIPSKFLPIIDCSIKKKNIQKRGIDDSSN